VNNITESNTLSVTATATEDAELSYQWYSNDAQSNTGGTTVASATSDTFTIPADLGIGTYYYYCVVSATGADDVASDVATVTVAPSTAKAITAFSLAGEAGTIDEGAGTIAVTVPYGTDVTGIAPDITHTGASIDPAADEERNFSNSVTYTVTAADSNTKAYTVTVTVAPSTAKSITAFSLAGEAGTIDETAGTIAVTVPYGTDVTSIAPTITHDGASISPAAGVPQNFTSPVTYTVTAADSSTKAYTVTVSVNSAPDATPNPGYNPSPGTGADPSPGAGSDPDPAPAGTDPVIQPVPGGYLTLPPDTLLDDDYATLPSSGDITLTDGVTKITVPPHTVVDLLTGTITLPDGGVITIPGEDKLLPSPDSIEIYVPAGTVFVPDTWELTLPDGGSITLPGPDRMIGSQSGDDMEFSVPAETTIDPYTGIITITRGGWITLPDGSAVMAVPGTTINPLTGAITQPEAETGGQEETTGEPGGSGAAAGCDGMGAGGLWAAALAASRLYSKFKKLEKGQKRARKG
jgi:hypothetical protein